MERLLIEASGVDPIRDIEPRATNEIALDLERLAALLGLELAPEGLPDRARPDETTTELFQAEVYPPIKDFFSEAVSQEGTIVRPQEFDAFFVEHLETLETIRARLDSADGALPHWELDFRSVAAFKTPELIDHFRLHALLLLCALRSEEAGQAEDVVRWLDAATRLRWSVAGRPTIMYVLVHQVELRHWLATLRRLETWPPGVREELEELRAQRTVVEEALIAYRLEPWFLIQVLRSGTFAKPDQIKLFQFFFEKLGRYGVRHEHIAMETMIEPVLDSGLVGFEPEEAFRRGMATIPRWSISAQITTPNFTDLFIKTARTELDIDLTLRAAEAEDVLAASGCDDVAPRQPSVVEGVDWLYDCRGSTLRIETTHTFEEGAEGLLLLPGLTIERSGAI